jgi:ureidoglycolate lyase
MAMPCNAPRQSSLKQPFAEHQPFDRRHARSHQIMLHCNEPLYTRNFLDKDPVRIHLGYHRYSKLVKRILERSSLVNLHACPLTAQAFSEFGEVIAHQGQERRHHFPLEGADGLGQAFWVTKVAEAISFPFTVSQMERHPHSDQAFFPLSGQRMLIVVCPSLPDGGPDLSDVRAFVSEPGQGILYRRNVWHTGMSVLDLPSEFVVTMAMEKTASDTDIFLPLDQPFHVDFKELV